MIFIIQIMAKKKHGHSVNNGAIYTAEHLKIHPVEAETGEEAVTKLQNYYGVNKPDWKIRLVDIEHTII